MATLTTFLSSGSDWDIKPPGDGICVFFYDSSSEFFPGGIGSALGYANYRGPMGYKAETLGNTESSHVGPASACDLNGMQKAYVGVGFDVKGNFSNTSFGKLGTALSGATGNTLADSVSSDYIATVYNNSIGVRLGAEDYYKVHSVTSNLSTYPIDSNEKLDASPSVTLHQTVTSRDDVVFQSARVTLQNEGKRVLVEIKDNDTGIYHTYHVADIDKTMPSSLRTGISFNTSDDVANCEIKNFTVQGNIVEQAKNTSLLKPASAHLFYVVYPDMPA